jgi:hypothetical protein
MFRVGEVVTWTRSRREIVLHAWHGPVIRFSWHAGRGWAPFTYLRTKFNSERLPA